MRGAHIQQRFLASAQPSLVPSRNVEAGPGGTQIVAAVSREELHGPSDPTVVGPVAAAARVDGGGSEVVEAALSHALQPRDQQVAARGVPREVREGLRDVRRAAFVLALRPPQRGAEHAELAL